MFRTITPAIECALLAAAAAFGTIRQTYDPRQVQLDVKMSFWQGART